MDKKKSTKIKMRCEKDKLKPKVRLYFTLSLIFQLLQCLLQSLINVLNPRLDNVQKIKGKVELAYILHAYG